MHSIFYEIAALLGLATLFGIAGQKLRQPLIIMFLATGIIAGPAGLDIIESFDHIELLAHIGIALLLFVVGLKLDVNLMRTTGTVALATGLGQIVFTSLIGFLIALAMDMPIVSAAYVAVALTFSSTIIIVKLLSDKKEIDSLHGQIAVGFLIVQDIAAILALVGLTTLGSQMAEEGSVFWSSVAIAGKGVGMLVAVALLMRFVLPGLTRRLSHSHELLTLFAVAWAVFLGAASEWLDFSKEVGAFLAGVSLASTGYRDAIGSRLTSLRDFLLLFFFIDLGARLDWSVVGAQLGASFVFSIFVLIGNPLIVLIIMGAMGYRRRTAFLAGLTVAQISEFSLIVAALGLSLGHISPETMGLITLVGVVTIFASTYMILYSGPLYRFLSNPLMLFERRNPYREAAIDYMPDEKAVDVIMVGLGTYGSGIAEQLMRRNMALVGVDFDPVNLEKWRARGLSVLYGDMEDAEIYEHLPLDRTRWVVSTIRSLELNLTLLGNLKARNFKGKVALAAVSEEEAALYEKSGAQVVFRPFIDASEQAADALSHAMDLLPKQVNWPIAFREIRIRSGTAFAGKTVRNIPLRAKTGASILAVSRAGRVHFDLGPDFQIYPNDRLVVMGHPEELLEAEALLGEYATGEEENFALRFALGEVRVGENSAQSGKTLADLQFRQQYGVTVVGIRRGEAQITTPGISERLQPGDCLIVVGSEAAVAQMEKLAPL